MVIRILTGKDVAGAVRYNEQKVEQGQAERIRVANYPNAEMADNYARYRLQLLEQYTRLNREVGKPSVHLAVAFHPSEVINKDQLREIGGEVMDKAGYGKQPYLMYQHHDTQHPHIHIVTVSVDANGNRISDKFMQRRLQQIRRQLEIKYKLVQAEHRVLVQEGDRVGEGLTQDRGGRQSMSKRLAQTLETYSFGSVDSLKQYLDAEGILMKTNVGRSQRGITFQFVNGSRADNRPVKASSLPSRPTQKRLAEQITSQADWHGVGCKKLATLIQQRLATYRSLTESEFRQSLHQLSVRLIDTGAVYLYVQQRTGIVAQAEELGTSLTRESLARRFSTKTEQVVIDSPVKKNRVNTELDKKPVAAAPGRSVGVKERGKKLVERAVIPLASESIGPAAPQDKDLKKSEKNELKPLVGDSSSSAKVDRSPGEAKKNQKKIRSRRGRRL